MTGQSPYPQEGTKQYMVLKAMLNGTQVDPFTALMEWNLPTLNARVSELRRMGWPIRSRKMPHPKVEGEKYVVFWLDGHFRHWIGSHPNRQVHPGEYPGKDGRGKFEGWTAEDFRSGEKNA